MSNKKSLLILSTIIIFTLIVGGIAAAVDIEEYIQEKDLTEVDEATLVMIFEESENINEESARNLINSFSEGEIKLEEIYSTKENLQELEDDGQPYENIEEIWPDYPSKEDFFFSREFFNSSIFCFVVFLSYIPSEILSTCFNRNSDSLL